MKVRELENTLVLSGKLALYNHDGDLLYCSYPCAKSVPAKFRTWDVINIYPIVNKTVGATIAADTNEAGYVSY